MAPPIILATNDDGIESPGLAALAEAIATLGEVHVVAPDRERSACAQSLTLVRPLRVENRGPRRHALDGTPADCVGFAVTRLLATRPALVVSGINRGANVGDDVFYSGTVGGAREGTFYGLPAVAVSLASKTATDFGEAARYARQVVAMVLAKGLPPHTLLNVNVPPGRPSHALVTVQGSRNGGADPRPGWDLGPRRTGDELADINAVEAGFVSITPLQTDTTHHAALVKLKDWATELRASSAGPRS